MDEMCAERPRTYGGDVLSINGVYLRLPNLEKGDRWIRKAFFTIPFSCTLGGGKKKSWGKED